MTFLQSCAHLAEHLQHTKTLGVVESNFFFNLLTEKAVDEACLRECTLKHLVTK